MKIYLSILSILGFTTCSAQQYAAKAYLNVSNGTFKSSQYSRYQNQNTRYFTQDNTYPSVAINYKNKRKNQHEIELNRINITNTETLVERINGAGDKTYMPSQKITTTQIRMRYEYILSFTKKHPVIFEPSVGFAALAYYEKMNATPYQSTDFPTSVIYAGTRFALTPRVSINITKRVFADINIPVCIMDAGIAKQNIANPTLPMRAQRYSIADVELFPSYYSLRIGAGVRI
jgi:hypothetical protein